MAIVDLGLTDEQFGDLTYAQFDALVNRRLEHERKEYIRAGIVASAIINTCGNPENPVSPLDFVPGEPVKKDLSSLGPSEQAAKVISQFSKREFRRGNFTR